MAPSSPIKGISYTRTFEADSQPPPLARRASHLQYKRSPSSDFIPGTKYIPESSHPDANSLHLRIPSLSAKTSTVIQDPYNAARDLPFEASTNKPSLARHSSFSSTFGSRQRNSQRLPSRNSSFSMNGKTPIAQLPISNPLESRQSYNTAAMWARKANHDLQNAARTCAEATTLAHVPSTDDAPDVLTRPMPGERIAIRRGSQVFYHTATSVPCPTSRPTHPLEVENALPISPASSVAASTFSPSVYSSNRGSISTNSTSPTTASTTRTNSTFNDSTNSRAPLEGRSSEDKRRVLFRRLGKDRVSFTSTRDASHGQKGRMSLDTSTPLAVIDGIWNPTPSVNAGGRMGMDEMRPMTGHKDGTLPSELAAELFEVAHQDDEVFIDPHSNTLAMNMIQSIKKPIDRDIVKEKWWKRMFRN